jgi:hypothetical protein
MPNFKCSSGVFIRQRSSAKKSVPKQANAVNPAMVSRKKRDADALSAGGRAN